MKVPMSKIERIVLSVRRPLIGSYSITDLFYSQHWHADHSGGILTALELIKADNPNTSVIVDLHPDRPIARGIKPPPFDKIIARLPEDPTFEQITAAGGQVEKHGEAHTVNDGAIYISGEIPRVTEHEKGLIGGCQYVELADGKFEWQDKPGEVRPHNQADALHLTFPQLILDERYLAIDVKGKGLVIASSCSRKPLIEILLHF